MAVVHCERREPLCLRRSDVVLAEHLQHRGAGKSDDDPSERGAERDRWEDKRDWAVLAHRSTRRKDWDTNRKGENEQEPEPEHRDRHADDRKHATNIVDDPVAPSRRHDPEWHANDERKEDARDG